MQQEVTDLLKLKNWTRANISYLHQNLIDVVILLREMADTKKRILLHLSKEHIEQGCLLFLLHSLYLPERNRLIRWSELDSWKSTTLLVCKQKLRSSSKFMNTCSQRNPLWQEKFLAFAITVYSCITLKWSVTDHHLVVPRDIKYTRLGIRPLNFKKIMQNTVLYMILFLVT